MAQKTPKAMVEMTALQSLKTRDGAWHARGQTVTVGQDEAAALKKSGKAEPVKPAAAKPAPSKAAD